MVYFDTSAEWFEQSSLLLKARPSSTKVSSKYTVLKPTASKITKHQNWLAKKASKTPSSSTTTTTPDASSSTLGPKATFELKAYDPVSGTCLKYQTNKAAEVGRLVGSLGKLGRHMAALPEAMEDLSAPAETGTGIEMPSLEVQAGKGATVPPVPQAGASGGGGGKKKKKGKK